MTPLSKPIKRSAIIALDNRRHGEEIVVALYPDKTIGFRRYRARKEIRLTLAAVYSMAIKAEIRTQQLEKKRARLQKRAGKASR